jgi:hypothetical protein
LALALLPLPFLAADRDDEPVVRRASARRDTTAPRDTGRGPDTLSSGGATAAAAGGSGGGGASASGAGDRTTTTAAGAVAPVAGGGPPAPTARPLGAPAPTAPSSGTAADPSATPFERHIAVRDRNRDEREQRRYTAQGLWLLADELRALGASASGLRAIRANADSLVIAGARRNAHPDYARAAFLAAIRELDMLGARSRAPVDTGRLRSIAWAIRPNQALLAQRRTVQSFFESARDALHVLSRAGAGRRRR